MTVAKAVEEEGRLVTSFFFFRSVPRRNNPSALVLAIAHDLVVTNPSCQTLIDQRIMNNPKILEARMVNQFRELVMKPYGRQTPPPPQKPHVMVMDLGYSAQNMVDSSLLEHCRLDAEATFALPDILWARERLSGDAGLL
ncbi:hypothetical protein PQX77_014231 [Marasmius sp. AFHP31]|nr:hypothetical protein PQX77_014231 [Marasmius sp. AFHP31]